MLWLTFLAAALIFLYIYVVKPLKFWKQRNVPCLEPMPVFGNFLQVFLQKESFADLIQKVYALAPKARFVGFYKFTTPVLLIKDPSLIPKVSDGEDFQTVSAHSQLSEIDSPKLRDETWKTLRAALSLPSINTKMRSLFLLMEDHAQQLVHVLEKIRNTQTVEMKELFGKYTNDVMDDCVCGGNKREDKNSLESSSASLLKLFGIKSFDRCIPSIPKSAIIDVIKDRNKEIKPELLELLIEARKCRRLADDAGNNVKIPEEEVLVEALLSFVSGSRTVVTLMCFLAYELATNPYIQRKLINEVERTLQECDGKLTYEALMGMTCLDMVVLGT